MEVARLFHMIECTARRNRIFPSIDRRVSVLILKIYIYRGTVIEEQLHDGRLLSCNLRTRIARRLEGLMKRRFSAAVSKIDVGAALWTPAPRSTISARP